MSATSQGHELGRGFYAVMAVIVLGVVLFLVPNLWRNYASSAGCGGIAGAEIWNMRHALEAYAEDHEGQFPDSLEAIVTLDPDGNPSLDCEGIPLDPWGNEYQYEPPGSGGSDPIVYSLGADGERGGNGKDADISSSELAAPRLRPAATGSEADPSSKK